MRIEQIERGNMIDHKINALRKAILDEGSHPIHHRQVMARHRREWAVLWKAIDELVKERPKETK